MAGKGPLSLGRVRLRRYLVHEPVRRIWRRLPREGRERLCDERRVAVASTLPTAWEIARMDMRQIHPSVGLNPAATSTGHRPQTTLFLFLLVLLGSYTCSLYSSCARIYYFVSFVSCEVCGCRPSTQSFYGYWWRSPEDSRSMLH